MSNQNTINHINFNANLNSKVDLHSDILLYALYSRDHNANMQNTGGEGNFYTFEEWLNTQKGQSAIKQVETDISTFGDVKFGDVLRNYEYQGNIGMMRGVAGTYSVKTGGSRKSRKSHRRSNKRSVRKAKTQKRK